MVIQIFRLLLKMLIIITDSQIYRYMAAISKNVYIDKLLEIVWKYIYTIHRSIKMKLADVKPNKNADLLESI